MKTFNKLLAAILTVTFSLGIAGLVKAATAINLGTADSFAILAGSGITNTGATTISGDVGTFPTTTQTGFGSVTLNGTNHTGDSVTQGAKTDLTTAYNNAAAQTPVTTIATELGGTTKTAGIYNSSAGTFGITGTLTLDAQGDSNAVFIFKAASTLITASSSNVVLVNGAQACKVFWQVGSSATLGTNSSLKGNILALTSVTLTTGAGVDGRVLARNGAVTLDTNTVSKATCATSTPTSTPTASPTLSSTPTTTPTPSSGRTPTLTPTPATGIGGTGGSLTPAPKLPNTGIAPDQKSMPWSILAAAAIFAVSTFLYFVQRKQKA